MTDFVFVEDERALEALCDALDGVPEVVLDTEFDSGRDGVRLTFAPLAFGDRC